MKPISLTDTTTVLFTYTYTLGAEWSCTRNFTPACLGHYLYLNARGDPTNNPTLIKGVSFSVAQPDDKKTDEELAAAKAEITALKARIAELEAKAKSRARNGPNEHLLNLNPIQKSKIPPFLTETKKSMW